ncbi:MAG: zf-HC2 domain-containing protein [Blastocatellia bacterium]
MSCNFTERLSLLIDGELEPDEAAQVKLHLSSCLICQQAQTDFLSLREQIKSHQYEPDARLQRQAIRRILNSERTPFWEKRIALPVPVLSLMLLAFVALVAWSVYVRATRPARIERAPLGNQSSQDGLDLSRFDRGERAIIYTTKR